MRRINCRFAQCLLKLTTCRQPLKQDKIESIQHFDSQAKYDECNAAQKTTNRCELLVAGKIFHRKTHRFTHAFPPHAHLAVTCTGKGVAFFFCYETAIPHELVCKI